MPEITDDDLNEIVSRFMGTPSTFRKLTRPIRTDDEIEIATIDEAVHET
jgi:hypothetical protein